MIAVLGHPARTSQMTLINDLGARAVTFWIQAKQDACHLGPFRSILRGIEQADVKDKVLAIVIGQG